MAINFEKSYTSTDAIVGILQERGLNVDNQEQRHAQDLPQVHGRRGRDRGTLRGGQVTRSVIRQNSIASRPDLSFGRESFCGVIISRAYSLV